MKVFVITWKTLRGTNKISFSHAQKKNSLNVRKKRTFYISLVFFSFIYQMCFNNRIKFTKKKLISRSFKHFNTSVCWQSLWNWLLTLDIRYRSSSNIEILSRDDLEVSTLFQVSFWCQWIIYQRICLPQCLNEMTKSFQSLILLTWLFHSSLLLNYSQER